MQEKIELKKYRTPYSKRFVKPNGDIQIEMYSISSNKDDKKNIKNRDSYNPSNIGLVVSLMSR